MSSHLMNETEEPVRDENAAIESCRVTESRADSSQMTVEFLISADSTEKAHAFARDPVLVEEGIRLVRKNGLASPGINERGIPVMCDANGKPLGNPMGAIERKPNRKYFYRVIHTYLGGED